MKKEFNLIATAAAGLEAVVGREVRELGYDCQVENGRVRFQGRRESHYRNQPLASGSRSYQDYRRNVPS